MEQTPASTDGVDDAKLIVNYLPPTLTEEGLRNLFAPYGQIASAKLIINRYTGQSLGYGFVRFTNAQSAQNAIHELHNFKIENKTLKVNVARPSAQSQTTNLYVSGLGQHITKSDLDAAFSPYGKIADSKILFDMSRPSQPVSRGIGFVRFAEREDAERAVSQLNDTILHTSRIKVKFADTQMDKMRKIRTGTLPLPGAAGQLRGPNANPLLGGRFDRQAGSAPFGMGYPSQMSSPFAMYSNQMALGAGLGGPLLGDGYNGGPPFDLGGQAGSEFTLFVYHLPQDADEVLIYKLFSPFGAIMNVKIIRDPSSGLCKSFGFVSMRTFQEANAAIAGLNGYNVPSTNKRLQVSFKSAKNKFQA